MQSDLLGCTLDWDSDGLDELPDHIPDWVVLGPDVLEVWPEAGCGCGCRHTPPEPVEEVGWAIPGVTWDREAPALPELSAAVSALQAAADAVCQVDPTRLSPEQALVDGQALLRIGQQLHVHDLRRLADVKDRKLYALAGSRTTASWLREVRPDADASDAGLAGKLGAFPVMSRSVGCGATSLRAAKKVVHALGRCRRHVDQLDGLIDGQPGEEVIRAVVRNVVDLVARCSLGLYDDDPRLEPLVSATEQILAQGGSDLARLEAAFTLLAEQVPLPALTGCLDELVLAVVPSLLEDRARRGLDNAGICMQLKDDGSGWQVEGDLDLECGERLFTALTAEIRRDPENPLDTEAAAALREQGVDPWADLALGMPGNGVRWPRDKRRRLHDALSRLLARYLEHGLGGTTQKVPVQVNVTISSQVLEGRPGAPPGKGDSGAAIPRSMLRRWWCDSRVTAFVLSRGGKALRTIHAGRTLTGLERRALAIEHGNRCAGIGCCRGGPDPTIDLRPHHVRRYADDGVTSIDETVLVCDTLHHDLHEGGKTVRLRDGRYLCEQGWADPSGQVGTLLP